MRLGWGFWSNRPGQSEPADSIKKSAGFDAITYDAHYCGVQLAKFNHDGSKMATASCDGSIRFWNFDTEQQLTNACSWMETYLETNPEASPMARDFCRNNYR